MDIKEIIRNNRAAVIVAALALALFLGYRWGSINHDSLQTTYANNTPIKSVDQYKDEICAVKGTTKNRKKVYYPKTSSSYSKLKNPVCFSTEQEAKSAGYSKAK